ncbi:hypothetical protein EIN_177930 [Entamoeba invadens IP1]|uniref:hypothetical protein n=1 Tax=Entamoeba invadens IP1 TaxID=370355 RepID=UPI0002C3D376|nr:hypothetical protein EIN_177930 [Entamoeba invadens IP1]ELP93886.1 hypothetical protein EIN_177930 [Entamoeba invadens IP1]|eukprot:XP_004260657.1 hypothetical protein EIN_177930 [Entamoeba invadens IP1]
MNLSKQQELFCVLIDKYINTEINTPNAVFSLQLFRDFPLTTSPQFARIFHVACKTNNTPVLNYFAATYPDYLDFPNVRGETPLFVAIAANQLEVVDFLLNKNCKADHVLPTGDNILHYIAQLPASPTKLSLIDKIATKYPTLVKSPNLVLETPLHLSALLGDLDAVKKFISLGADSNDKTTRGVDALGYAQFSGNRETIVYLKNFCKKDEPALAIKVTSVEPQGTQQSFSGKNSVNDDSSDDEGNSTPSLILNSNETTVDELYTKFANYVPPKTSKVKNLFKKVHVSKKLFQSEMGRLIKESFISRSMLEIPNDFGKGKKYRVLSLDGGGIKVLMSVIILRRLCVEFPDLLTKCNLFCGVSASSAVVSLISMGYSMEGLLAVCENIIRYSFKKDSIQSVTNAKYINDYLQIFGQTAFGDLPLKNLPRHVLIPAFLIDNGVEPRYCRSETFTNIKPGNDTEKVADICLRSAAAPSYYKPYQNYVDGGIIDNIPCGLAWPYLTGEKGIGIDPKDIVCLSISAGRPTPAHLDAEKIGGGGMVQWATQLVDLFMLARRDETVKEAKMMFGERFHRVDPVLPGQIMLDNVDQIDEVKRIAETCDLEDMRRWIRKYWY